MEQGTAATDASIVGGQYETALLDAVRLCEQRLQLLRSLRQQRDLVDGIRDNSEHVLQEQVQQLHQLRLAKNTAKEQIRDRREAVWAEAAAQRSVLEHEVQCLRSEIDRVGKTLWAVTTELNVVRKNLQLVAPDITLASPPMAQTPPKTNLHHQSQGGRRQQADTTALSEFLQDVPCGVFSAFLCLPDGESALNALVQQPTLAELM